MRLARPLLLFGSVAAIWWLGGWLLPPIDPPTAGQFGDKFGAVNALFSGLAFAGLVYTLLHQHEDREADEKQRQADEKQRQSDEKHRRETAVVSVRQTELQALIARMTATESLLRSTEVEFQRFDSEIRASRMTDSPQVRDELNRRVEVYRSQLRQCIEAVDGLQPLPPPSRE